MSVTQRWSGAVAVKSRASRFGATAKACDQRQLLLPDGGRVGDRRGGVQAEPLAVSTVSSFVPV
jgi:hypothetical protein